MARFTVATRIWFVALAALACGLVALTLRDATGPPVGSWSALALLGLCAAIAHRFPVKSGSEASYRLTNVFLIAGTLLLPPALLPLLVVAALTPDSIIGKRGRGIFIRLLVNLPPVLIAVTIAGFGLDRLGGVGATHGIAAVLLMGLAGALVTVLQNLLFAVGMALNFHLPLWRTDPLTPAALQGDAVFALLGIAVAGLWLADPALLLLLLPILVLAYRLTSTAHLAQLAQTDAKTGLHNARHFEEALADEITRAARTGRPFGLLFADLDHFKEVNDRHGHDAGDRVLQAFGTLLSTCMRPGDVVARFGGEEFVALMPGTDAEEARYIAERLRTAVQEHRFPIVGAPRLRRTVSIGVAAYPGDGATAEALLRRADEAMYRAKRTRNAVATSEALPSVPRLVAAAPAPASTAPASTPPSRRATVTLWTTVALGILALALSLPTLLSDLNPALLVLLLVLGVGADLITIQVFESERQRFSLSFGIVAALIAVAALPAAAPLVTVVAAAAHVLRSKQWGRNRARAIFNLTSPACAAGIAALTYATFSPHLDTTPLLGLLPGALAATLYYATNTLMVTLNIAAHTGRPLRHLLGDVHWAAPATILLGLTGAFIGAQHGTLGASGVLMLVLPLVVMRYTLGFAARKSRQAFATLRSAKAEAEAAHAEKEQTLRQLIDVVAAIIDARDQAVAGHSARVATYATALGEALGIDARERAYLHTAGLLHDLGKIAVPEAILHKPAKLTDAEFSVVKEHAAIGERILAEVLPLAEVARMVGDHHERFDGHGYPTGEAGLGITLGGRIVAVADTLDSILSDRPYSRGKPLDWALAELDRCAGAHFDPAVVAALHRVVATRGHAFFAVGTDRDKPVPARDEGLLIPFRHPQGTGELQPLTTGRE